ncbi:hypothetical protein BDP27DRAFT_1346336 [Rhodocollybia butyracea]|uniref:Uncharacterized protein n=1 Tax=Rhodocollybia butyracea TaxID=206335 RepID=A0A9P5P6I6_9AGAR|nr:hypothetical protein BDP27DRAFT_1346336 [Rhodocollybia butyracea]
MATDKQNSSSWAIAGEPLLFLRYYRNYTNPPEQRQICQLVLESLSLTLSSSSYTYYELAEPTHLIYKAFTLSAFLCVTFVCFLIEFVAASGSGHKAENSIARKDKRPHLYLDIYRCNSSVKHLTFSRIRGFNFHFANVYFKSSTFLVLVCRCQLFLAHRVTHFYGLTKEELVGRRPLANPGYQTDRHVTWYQSFVFSALEGRVIHGTQYCRNEYRGWTNALTICLESMIFFAAFSGGLYPSVYRVEGAPHTSDFAMEIWYSLKFFIAYIPPATRPDFNRHWYHDGRAAYVTHGNSLAPRRTSETIQVVLSNELR